jgi:hypothetical protein
MPLVLYERGNKLDVFIKNRDDMSVLFPKTPLLSPKTYKKRSHLIYIYRIVFDFSTLQFAPCFFLCFMDFL